MSETGDGIRVMKFGGSSLADGEAVRQVGTLVREATADRRVIVVVSALGGVTNQLLEAADNALHDYSQTRELYSGLHGRHMRLVEELLPAARRGAVCAEMQVLFKNLEDVLHGVYLVRECSPRSRDLIVSYGERLSALVMASYLDELGVHSRWVDARPLVLTREGPGDPVVDRSTTFERLRAVLADAGEVPVVTGFIASNEEGITTTLGRNGSDTTATLVGAALGAELVELWTDVDGIYSTDPTVIPSARVLDRMTFDEVQEMAYFGAGIVHPQALQPAAEAGIPVIVRNTFNPDHPGTLISGRGANGEQPVRAISAINQVALVNLEGSGMIGVLGVAGRLFSALAAAGVNIIMISQASSEHSICFVIRSHELRSAIAAVKSTFERELELGLIQRIDSRDQLTVLSMIGSRMRGTVGLSGRFFGALGAAGVNVQAISQGSSERNISIVIANDDRERALAAVHRAFALDGGETDG